MSRNRCQVFVVMLAALGSGALAVEPEEASDRVTVRFSDPSRPGTVKCQLMNGAITVTGYDGSEVKVEARTDAGRKVRRRLEREDRGDQSLKRLLGGTGLVVEEQNNVLTVSLPGPAADVRLEVPRRTALVLRSMNGAIRIEGVEGEIEAQGMNQKVTLMNVTGPVVAHSLNGGIEATFVRVADKPMSFSSMNGKIDVTFPANLKANVKVNGGPNSETYCDFDVVLGRSGGVEVEDRRKEGGRFRARRDSTIAGTINGGGAELQFKNYNGGIYIRRGK